MNFARDASPHSHGRSEVLDRPNLAKPLRDAAKILGLRLRTLRNEHQLSQEDAAEIIGIHSKHVQRIESGKGSNVTIATLIAICMAFGVPLEQFVAGIFQPPPPPDPARLSALMLKKQSRRAEPVKQEKAPKAAVPKAAAPKAAAPKAAALKKKAKKSLKFKPR